MSLSYLNKRGETVCVDITNHARRRFQERWHHAFPSKPFPGDVDEVISQWFAKAQRMNAESRIYRVRLRRHGKDTLFFSASPFVFVVQSASLRTVELGTPETRRCNKMQVPPGTLPRQAATPVVSPSAALEPSRSRYRFIALFLNQEGITKTLTLGRSDEDLSEEEVWKLGKDPEFQQSTVRTFREKNPDWTILAVYARHGNNAPLIPLIDLRADTVSS